MKSLIKSLVSIITFVSLLLGFNKKEASYELDQVIEAKIDSLLAIMTLEEKVGQMNQYHGGWDVTGPAPTEGDNQMKYDQVKNGLVGSLLNVVGAEATRKAQELAVENSRLGIPLIFGYDVIHGYQTMFPVPLGEAASWDMEAIEQSARVAATEAAAAGVHWTFAPMVDIARDARWGRIMEGAGEDPYLGAQIAGARVRGFQGNDLSVLNTIAACAKHYAAYGLAESGKDYNTVDISENTLRNVVLPPFKACVDAGVATFMNSFNEIGGIPTTGSNYLQRKILKGEWGFNGFVVSDWGSITEMIQHGFAENLKESAYLAVTAGNDMDMESRSYINHLVELVESGAVSESLINEAVRRILRIKYELGLFDDPYRYSNVEREKETMLSKEHLEIARNVARKSIVLLKNNNSILPLKKDVRKLAVIGPLAADKDVPLGNWRGNAISNSAVSLLEGIQAAVSPKTKISFAEGCKLVTGGRIFRSHITYNEDDRSGFSKAINIAKSADVVIIALGEDSYQTGEGRSQADIGLKGLQEELLKAIYAVNKNIVVVLMNGRPMTIKWTADHIPAILEAWYLGSEAGNAIADVLFGNYNPSGKLPVSFPRSVGQLPLYYNHKNTGRPGDGTNREVFWSHYTDELNTPLYPFGHGLSYTTFEYSDIQLSAKEIGLEDELKVSVTVKNSGQYAGHEVVQLYIRDGVASMTRPVKELKDFQKIHLNPGQSKKVTFILSSEDLAFYGADGKWKAEPGEFKVFIGTSSQNVKESSFVLR